MMSVRATLHLHCCTRARTLLVGVSPVVCAQSARSVPNRSIAINNTGKKYVVLYMLWQGMPKAMRRWAENDNEKDYRKKGARRRRGQQTNNIRNSNANRNNVLNICVRFFPFLARFVLPHSLRMRFECMHAICAKYVCISEISTTPTRIQMKCSQTRKLIERKTKQQTNEQTHRERQKKRANTRATTRSAQREFNTKHDQKNIRQVNKNFRLVSAFFLLLPFKMT